MPNSPANPVLVPLNEAILPPVAILLYRWLPVAPYQRSWHPVLIWRRIVNRMIAGSGRGPYCHAAILANGRVYETTQFFGGRTLRLVDAVSRHPGRIDVYSINTAVAAARGETWDPAKADRGAHWLVGQKYGWRSVIRAGLRHTWLGRFFMKPDLNDANGGSGPPMCSQGVDIIVRYGGVELIPNCASSSTEPNDFMRSSGADYEFTLTFDMDGAMRMAAAEEGEES